MFYKQWGKYENEIQPTYAQAIQDSSVHKIYFSYY